MKTKNADTGVVTFHKGIEGVKPRHTTRASVEQWHQIKFTAAACLSFREKKIHVVLLDAVMWVTRNALDL